MQEEIQMIKEALEMCYYELKLVKLARIFYWLSTFIVIFSAGYIILTATAINIATILSILGIAGLGFFNTKRHNDLVLDIQDLEYALEELTKE